MARAKKQKTLPFVVKPRLEPVVEIIGTEESGQIEIERRGYLTVAEKAFAQAAATEDESMIALQKLVGKISKEQGVDKASVFDAIVADNKPAYFDKYEDEVNAVLMGMMAYQEKNKLIQATALIYSRVDSEWGVENTLNLHTDIVEGLSRLYTEEESKNIEALEAAAENGVAKAGK